MIATIILWVSVGILKILSGLFSALQFVIPSGFRDGLIYIFSHFAYLNGWLDLDTLFTVAGTYFTFSTALIAWKIIKWTFSLIPWIGKSTSSVFPSAHEPVTLYPTRDFKTGTPTYSVDHRTRRKFRVK